MFPGWGADAYRVSSAGPSAAPPAHSMEPQPAAHSTSHQSKRRRLSLLLDKLSVQLNNNNNYPTPPWLLPTDEQDDELPLDLSLKSDRESRQETFPCTACGQTFAVPDRLTKHIASRHRNKNEGVRAYECEICSRKFARSDMLTRHARLHSGLKPYACAACGQVFSRSDHLATHQRTHTGEKPYRCPNCPYAACRRDMITRHMRTHVRRAPPA